MMRFRIGKFWARGSVPRGNSETIKSFSRRASFSARAPSDSLTSGRTPDRDRASIATPRRRVSLGVHAPREARDDGDAG